MNVLPLTKRRLQHSSQLRAIMSAILSLALVFTMLPISAFLSASPAYAVTNKYLNLPGFEIHGSKVVFSNEPVNAQASELPKLWSGVLLDALNADGTSTGSYSKPLNDLYDEDDIKKVLPAGSVDYAGFKFRLTLGHADGANPLGVAGSVFEAETDKNGHFKFEIDSIPSPARLIDDDLAASNPSYGSMDPIPGLKSPNGYDMYTVTIPFSIKEIEDSAKTNVTKWDSKTVYGHLTFLAYKIPGDVNAGTGSNAYTSTISTEGSI